VTNQTTFLQRLPMVRRLDFVFRHKVLARWFDIRHNVVTCREADPRALGVVGTNAEHAIVYIPTTPQTGRFMLRDLPIKDVSHYTFIDMGSGKGRMLLLAAELPFRRIIGVEFASDLSALAQRNVKKYRNAKQACFDIETLNVDAMQFEFPPEPSVIYFFYPFERFVMEPVIHNLNRSLAQHPRDVLVVYLNPVLTEVVEAASHLRVYARTEYFGCSCTIYRSTSQETAS
jgi:SAM-dependent methyltransferase